MREKIGIAEVNYDKCGGLKLHNRMLEVEKYFIKPKYRKLAAEARVLFEMGKFDACAERLEKLPSNGDLLEKLVEKLKGKSVYKTLKQIQEGKVRSSLITAKGLSSLLTHIIIEVEQGNDEYRVLVPNVIEKLNEVVYNTLR